MKAKFIKLNTMNGESIFNINSVSSVHERSLDGAKYLEVKLTDGSNLFIEMKIDAFYELISNREPSEPLDDYFE